MLGFVAVFFTLIVIKLVTDSMAGFWLGDSWQWKLYIMANIVFDSFSSAAVCGWTDLFAGGPKELAIENGGGDGNAYAVDKDTAKADV